MRYRRTVWPIALIALGVAILLGCIPIPGNYRRLRGTTYAPVTEPRPEESIGDAGSDKPLKLSRASMKDVLRVLGEPDARTSNGQSFVYAYRINNVSWLFPLCFTSYPDMSPRYLRIDFDGNDLLSTYKVFDKAGAEKAGVPTPSPDPDRALESLK